MASSLSIEVSAATIIHNSHAVSIILEGIVRLLEAARDERKIAPLGVVVCGVQSDDFKWQRLSRIEVFPLQSVPNVVGFISNGHFLLDWALASIVESAVATCQSSQSDIEEAFCAELAALALCACSLVGYVPDINEVSVEHHELALFPHCFRIENDTVGFRKLIRKPAGRRPGANLIPDAKVQVQV